MKLNKENIVIILLIVVLTVTAVIITINPRVPMGLREGVIATVNGEEIEEEEYNKLLD